ncbi:MAG: T9SS type A sorting domain-containing protein [Flammeovirgaceae bacterium]|jgi:hypothetical protein|nr:T9SS type A sorting domain-containing protein [Flammeovirgaceae bacterium]|tara:strand:- start:1696 stop:2184 length:489 start_codon:yes stop_codon:yes gene_type:complete
MYNGEAWQHFNKDNGLPSNQVNALQVLVTSSGSIAGRADGTSGGQLWLGLSSVGVIELDIDAFLKETEVEDEITLGVEENILANGVVLFPNPTQDQINLSWDGLNTASEVQLINLSGQVIYRAKIEKGNNETSINIEHLKAGIYMIQWNSQNTSQKLKFIKH